MTASSMAWLPPCPSVGGMAWAASPEGDAAAVEGGQWLGEVVDVVPQDVLGAGGGEDGGDRVVPVAEAAQEFGLLVVGRAFPAGVMAAA
ncbi:hypothetical protein SHIRM173S_05376 [Streptomyces hirsutus]